MNAREARFRLLDALDRVGRLTAAQAGELLDVPPSVAARWLAALVRDGLAVKSRDAWWSSHSPRLASAHRALIADIYARLVRDPRCLGWENAPASALPRPDAWILWGTAGADALRVALEADTGTETTRQWRDKLAAYQAGAPSTPLLIITRTRARAVRLVDLSSAVTQAVGGTPQDLPSLLDTFQTVPPTADVGPAAESPSLSRLVEYRFQDEPVSQGVAYAKIQRGEWRWAARVREAGRDIQHLRPK